MVNTFGEPKTQETITFSLVQNGTDSFKKAEACIKKVDGLVKGVDHTLKDTVIFLNHGIEILLKVMLAEIDVSLMFKKRNEYLKAKEKMIDEKDVFEVNPKLQTVSATVALERLKNSSDVEIDSKLEDAVKKLGNTRNKIMHFDLTLDKLELIEELKSCYEAFDDFFNKHIKSFNIHITEARFEFTKEDESEQNEAWEEAKNSGLFD